MTFSQFKIEMDIVRDRRRAMRSILRDLSTLSDDRLSALSSGAVDYSKDRLQKTTDPDAAMINTLDQIDRDTARLKDKLQHLRDLNEYYESLIFAADGIGGEVGRLYVIEGLTMKIVAQHLHYSPSHCWMKWTKTMHEIHEAEEERFNGST